MKGFFLRRIEYPFLFPGKFLRKHAFLTRSLRHSDSLTPSLRLSVTSPVTEKKILRLKCMDNISNKDIEWLLNLHKSSDKKRTPAAKAEWKKILIRFLIGIAGIFGLIIFPFLLLIRTAVYLNLHIGLSAWAALAGGILATILLLLIYLYLLFHKVKNKKLLMKAGAAGVSVMVFGFCLFSLFYLSGVHAKNDEVRELYRTMHPILRVAVSTVTLADGDLVITDIERVEDDYPRMELPVNPASMHYRQKSGYVHAVDIRTLDRGFIRNNLLSFSLELMGFRTLRHIGTADHLHVELNGEINI